MKKEEKKMKEKKLIKTRFFVLIILFVCFAITSIYLSYSGITIEQIKDYLLTSEYRGIFFILFYITTSFVPLPFAPTSFLGAFLFYFTRAFIYTLIGSLIFSTLMFYLARILGRDFVITRLKKDKYPEIREQINKGRLKDLILIRFFFILPSEFVNLVYGLSEIKFWRYFLGTLIGNIPVIFFSIMLIRAKLAKDNFYFILSIVFLSLLIIIPILSMKKIRKFLKKIK